jgi:hypothetical protein
MKNLGNENWLMMNLSLVIKDSLEFFGNATFIFLRKLKEKIGSLQASCSLSNEVQKKASNNVLFGEGIAGLGTMQSNTKASWMLTWANIWRRCVQLAQNLSF